MSWRRLCERFLASAFRVSQSALCFAPRVGVSWRGFRESSGFEITSPFVEGRKRLCLIYLTLDTLFSVRIQADLRDDDDVAALLRAGGGGAPKFVVALTRHSGVEEEF